MDCSRRHQVISLADAANLPRGVTTARCSECGRLILAAAPLQSAPSSGTLDLVLWALAAIGTVAAGWGLFA